MSKIAFHTSTVTVENTYFANLVVEYGGAFFVSNEVDAHITNIQLWNVKATGYVDVLGSNYGGAGFIFIGNNFYGNGICCKDMSTQYRSIILTRCLNTANNQLNQTSVDSCQDEKLAIVIGPSKCVSSQLNGSRTYSTGSSHVGVIHLAWSPSKYYMCNFIGLNNTGETIIGPSTTSTELQIMRDIVVVNNNVSIGIFQFWKKNHKIINAYIHGNTKKGVVWSDNKSDIVVEFEGCYHDGIDGITVDKSPKTFYETNTFIPPQQCKFYEEFAKLCLKTFKHRRRRHISIFISIILKTIY